MGEITRYHTLWDVFSWDDYETIPQVTAHSLFATMEKLTNFPHTWLTEDNAGWIDNLYFKYHSGDKLASPYLNKFAGYLLFDGVLRGLEVVEVANTLLAMYHEKWDKLFAVMQEEYNPLENYSMEEEETPNITRTREEKEATNLTQTSSANTSAGMYGFNSADSVPQSTSNGGGTSTTQGAANDNTRDTSETETGSRKLTRAGNIGVTTSQQMLESEWEVRRRLLYEEIFRDVDKILTIPIY